MNKFEQIRMSRLNDNIEVLNILVDYLKYNPVFSIFNGPWTRLLKEHNNVLSPSEIFYHIFCLWDDIRENPNIAENKCEYFSEHFVEKIKELIAKCRKDISPRIMEKYLTPELNEFLIFSKNYGEPVDMILQYAKILY